MTAVGAVLALTAGTALVGMGVATAAGPVSQAEGRFLGGTVLGLDLDSVLTVAPATAVNPGEPDRVVSPNPLDVSALNAVDVEITPGVNLLGDNALLSLGAVNQVAVADADGGSLGASGAVNDSGAIDIGGAGVPPSDATLDLAPLIDTLPAVSPVLSDAGLTVGAVAATATQAAGAGAQTGDYGIASLDLSLTSPTLAAVTGDLDATLTSLQPTVDGLVDLISDVVPGAEVTGIPDLADLVATLSVVSTADGSITADLDTGVITIDIAAVLAAQGLDLNDLGPSTSLVPFITDALTTELLPAISAELTALGEQIAAAIDSIEVVTVLGPVVPAVIAGILAAAIDEVTAPIDVVVAGLGDEVITPLATALETVLELNANVQTTADGVFTERALQIGLVPAAPVALINLASASVGPNQFPLPTPTATGIDPGTGPETGGTTVTITGTGFVPDATT
ncbi:choice-of-anchor G family protein, partial [Nakamurella leprariae]